MTSVHAHNGPMESPLNVKQFAVAALKLHRLFSDSFAHGHTCACGADHGKSEFLLNCSERDRKRETERANSLITAIIIHHNVSMCTI